MYIQPWGAWDSTPPTKPHQPELDKLFLKKYKTGPSLQPIQKNFQREKFPLLFFSRLHSLPFDFLLCTFLSFPKEGNFFINQDSDGLVITLLSCRDRTLQWPTDQLPRAAGRTLLRAVLQSVDGSSYVIATLPILGNVKMDELLAAD